MWLILNQNGSRALVFTSLLEFSIDDQAEVVSTPIEQGSFANYNKVETPTTISVSLAVQGNDQNIDEFIATLQDLKDGIEIVSFQTPEAFYENYNISGYSYARSNETGPFVFDLVLVEIREVETQITTTEFTRPSVKNPTSASNEDTGKAGTEDRRSILKKFGINFG